MLLTQRATLGEQPLRKITGLIHTREGWHFKPLGLWLSLLIHMLPSFFKQNYLSAFPYLCHSLTSHLKSTHEILDAEDTAVNKTARCKLEPLAQGDSPALTDHDVPFPCYWKIFCSARDAKFMR